MTSTSAPATRLFRILGTTQDVTTCGLCGRDDLKGTTVLQYVEDGEVVYFGSSCGRKATGWTVAEVRKAARAADAEAREAARREFAAKCDAETAEFLAWVRETYGFVASQPADLWGPAKAIGKTPFALRSEWRAA